MSDKVSRYMMLAFIDSEIMRLEKSKEESIAFQDKHPWEFDDAKLRMTIKTIEILLAIRALITDYPRLKAKYDALRGKVTREEMRETLDYLVEGRQVGFSRGLATKHLEDCVDAICALIEHGPEVSRGFVVNSARAMGVAPDALRICLEEAGVTVKEGK